MRASDSRAGAVQPDQKTRNLVSNEHHGADAVEPDHNSTDDQTPIEGADALSLIHI